MRSYKSAGCLICVVLSITCLFATTGLLTSILPQLGGSLEAATARPRPTREMLCYDASMTELSVGRITDLSSAQSLTIATGTTYVFLQPEDGSIRVSASTTPTGTLGIIVEIGGDLWLPLNSPSDLKAIQIDSGAKVSYACFGY